MPTLLSASTPSELGAAAVAHDAAGDAAFDRNGPAEEDAAFRVLSVADASKCPLPAAGKPNAIVRPTRRRPEPQPPSMPHGGRAGGAGGINHSALFEYVAAAPMSQPPVAAGAGAAMDKFDGETNFGLGSFTRELDLKLRRLQGKSSSKNVRIARIAPGIIRHEFEVMAFCAHVF